MTSLPNAAEEPSDTSIDADLLLVSQIGGLRAKSVQAQAASAKLTTAIAEARERQDLQRTRNRDLKQCRLRALSRWLVDPMDVEMVRLLNAWQLAAIHSKKKRIIELEQERAVIAANRKLAMREDQLEKVL